MKKALRRLAVSRETIRVIASVELARTVVTGFGTGEVNCPAMKVAASGAGAVDGVCAPSSAPGGC